MPLHLPPPYLSPAECKNPNAFRISRVNGKWPWEDNTLPRRTRYLAYLLSPFWKRVRNAALEAAGGRCEKCRKLKRITAHHLTYDNLFTETTADLLIVCWPCHQIVEAISHRLKNEGNTAPSKSQLLDSFESKITTPKLPNKVRKIPPYDTTCAQSLERGHFVVYRKSLDRAANTLPPSFRTTPELQD